jgi:KaiC/GvpD/RAD55 family RecA-like ATPase
MTSQHMAEASADRRIQLMEFHLDPERYRPRKIGLYAFDRCGGVKLGTYVAVLGPDKSGKSALVARILLALGSKGDVDVIINALEESKADWADRAVTFMSHNITRTRILELKLDEDDFDEWARDATPQLATTSIYIEDRMWSAKEILDTQIAVIKKIMADNNWTIEEYKKLGRQRIIIIDGIQLLNDFPDESENNKLAKISRMFMEARGLWNLTIVAVFQLNKAGRIYGNESAYKDATVLVQLRRKKADDGGWEPGMAQMEVLPNRQSAPFPYMDILVDGNHSRVQNVDSVVVDEHGDTLREPSYEDLFEDQSEPEFWKDRETLTL